MTEQSYLYQEVGGGKPLKMWIRDVPVEDGAKQQLENIARLPFIYKHIAVMPDVHYGRGSTVGSIIPTKGAIVPASVGVDIGCGLIAQKLSISSSDLPDGLSAIRHAIESAVPHGRTDNGGINDRGAWHNIPEGHTPKIMERLEAFKLIEEKHPKLKRPSQKIGSQLCSLGTGNHFIELCLDQDQGVWVMLHSGSRGIGNAIGTYFIEKAKEEMRKQFIHLPDQDLAYLVENSALFDDYIEGLSWAQDYARINRELMMKATIAAINKVMKGVQVRPTEMVVNCHHNYAQRETHFGESIWVTRKGAVSARDGELGIIPGSMGTKSFIVRGKGNPDSFLSCSHGAGRRMSRGEAKRTFTLDDHRKATEGVECRKDKDVIDETPGAYKDIGAVIAAQADLIDIAYELKQVLCVKG